MSNDDKVAQRIRQIIKVRQIILDNSFGEVIPHATRLLLSTYISVINQNYQSNDLGVQTICKACKTELKKMRKEIPCLIRRQQIAAYLILYAPWLHRIIYKIYDSRR